MSFKLHEYQRVAVEHVQSTPRSALLLEMGTGKTAITLSSLMEFQFPVLVIAPPRVARFTWPEEAAKWRPELQVAAAVGSPGKRREALDSGADIVTISWESIDQLTAADARRFKTVVLDELSMAKSSKSKRFKTARRFIQPHHRVIGLTGTPMPNGPMDLWSQIRLIDGGERLGKTITGYRERYFTPGRYVAGGIVAEWNPKPGAQEAIEKKISDIALSMRAIDHLDMPEFTSVVEHVELPPKVRKVYDQMRNELVVDLEMLDGGIHSAANAAVVSNRLSQITAGFLYGDLDEVGEREATTVLHDAKIKAAVELVESIGSPVLMFWRYHWERDALRAALPGAHTVDEPDVFDRWNQGKVPVLLAHPASVAMGLNLQHGGHHIVWVSPTWSQELTAQANARLNRQGQKHPVVAHYLVCLDTVDEAILSVVERKASAQDALMRHLRRTA